MSPPPMGAPRPMSAPPSYPRFDESEYPAATGFGPDFGGRRGRVDMTHEMRFDLNGSHGAGGVSPSELQRIDAMRRTFTARRFGMD